MTRILPIAALLISLCGLVLLLPSPVRATGADPAPELADTASTWLERHGPPEFQDLVGFTTQELNGWIEEQAEVRPPDTGATPAP